MDTLTAVGLTRLVLTNFRCYSRAQLDLDVDDRLVVLAGPNGAGKTNVLEAISYFAPGRGLRHASLGDIVRAGSREGWAASGLLSIGDEPVKVGTGFGQGVSEGTRRTVKIDGAVQTNTSALGDRWSISWLTPQMDRLFIEGPGSRRKFLDRLVMGLFPDHSRQIAAFERAMRDRNRLLSDHGSAADGAWLSALEARMAEHGVAIAVARLEYAGQLAGKLEEGRDQAFPVAGLAIDGELEQALQYGSEPVEVEEDYRASLAALRSLDAKTGRTSKGVHKSDLLVTHREKAMSAALCSTGEQKALLIALVIANARLVAAIRGHAPILLLDEIVAHLDRDRRRALFETLRALSAQCWMTGTDTVLFDEIKGNARFFDVSDGVITSSN